MTTLVFDIETVPDVELGRRICTASRASTMPRSPRPCSPCGRQDAGTRFLPHVQQRVVAISCVLRSREGLKVWSLGDPHSPRGGTDRALLRRHRELLAGSRVLERRRISICRCCTTARSRPACRRRATGRRASADTAFRYNNYLSRFHWRHLDLMDVLSGFQARARASLADVAALLGSAGQARILGRPGLGCVAGGRSRRIRRYCETDVLNTYLIYLRFELMRGQLPAARHAEEVERVKSPAARVSRAASRASSCVPGKRGSDGAQRSCELETGAVAALDARGRGHRPRRQDGFRRRRAARGDRPLSAHARHRQHDEGQLLEVHRGVAGARDAALRALRGLRRLRAAASVCRPRSSPPKKPSCATASSASRA